MKLQILLLLFALFLISCDALRPLCRLNRRKHRNRLKDVDNIKKELSDVGKKTLACVYRNGRERDKYCLHSKGIIDETLDSLDTVTKDEQDQIRQDAVICARKITSCAVLSSIDSCVRKGTSNSNRKRSKSRAQKS